MLKEKATQEEGDQLLTFALTWGWEEFFFHVGHFFAVLATDATGDKRDALLSAGEVIHSRLALWRWCGSPPVSSYPS